MPERSKTPVPDQEQSPEFKLQVVLEYLRNPRRKRRILKEKGITEEQLEEWHREFLDRAGELFSGGLASASPSPVKSEPFDTHSNIEKRTPASPPAESQSSPAAEAWGIRLNRGWSESYQPPSSSKRCPSWVGRFRENEWEHEPGLVVWLDASKTFERIRPWETLELFEKMRQDDHWRTEGVRITERIEYEIRDGQRTNGTHWYGKRKARSAPVEPGPKREFEEVEEELMRLDQQASIELYELLQQHESMLKEMADEEQKRIDKAWRDGYDFFFRVGHENEARDIDLSKRQFPWVKQADKPILVCDIPPNRASVKISDPSWFWHVCIEQPDHLKHERSNFVWLEEALAWAEGELTSIQETAKARDQLPEPAGGTTRSQIDLTPYYIDPATLEAERITYRVVIYLERVPAHFKTMEMSFGKLMRYDEKYPSLLKVLDELELDESVVKFEQPGGINFGWYFLFSTATYYEEAVARAQAQKLWEGSAVQRLYKEGKVTRARFGIEEVETDFCIWLGGLEDPQHPWERLETRAEHMANLAKEETIVYALDVVRFREDRRISPKYASDEELLQTLHERRVQSKHIPIEARVESERWLANHSSREARNK